MAEIKNSVILEEVFKNAKAVGQEADAALTADRFMVALLDAVEKCDNDNTELAEVKSILDEHKIDLKSAKEVLLARIEKNSDNSPDVLYLQLMLRKAQESAAESGKEELTADALLTLLFSDLGDTIRSILPENTEKPAEGLPEGIDERFERFIDMLDSIEDTDDENDSADDENTTEDVKADVNFLVAKVKYVRKELQASVLGQDNAINLFIAGYFQANLLSMIDPSRRRPKATFLFAGPPGVGKTFLAEKVAEALQLPFMRFDMSEYADKEANLEFCGSDKVYKNGKPGNVTGFVEDNPECVLLFDEIEKAHMCVIHLFLQMLDAGRLRDSHTDREVSFTNTIIVLTTNAGKQLYEESESGDFSSVSRKVIINALQNDINPQTNTPYFPSAICSRFASSNVVMFNRISAHNLKGIAEREIERQASNLEKNAGIKIEVDDRVYAALLFSEGSAADARTVRSRAETFFNDELYELLSLLSSERAKTSILDVEKVQISLDLSHSKAEIVSLFETSGKTKILVFADTEIVNLCKTKTSAHEILGTNSAEEAIKIIRNDDIGFVLIDMCCGISKNTGSLNIEDVESQSRDFFRFLREQGKGIPIYILEGSAYKLSDEEKTSLVRQGGRGVIPVKKGRDSFESRINAIATAIHQQANMIKLARENKLISFETSQTISRNGKNAEIRLFDFKMNIAVDSGDQKSVMSSVSKPNVKFDDVIGADEAKKELTYFVEYLRNPKKYMGTGVKAPKGVLLYGSPGTGKTMLAKAMAAEAGVAFIIAEGNHFLKKYVGEGSEKVHELFKTARKYAPSILFIDEIDAIAKERQGFAAPSDGTEATLTAFLSEMDGFVSDPSKPVFVLAATNFDVEPGRNKSLDPALMRRFDRRVYIELPNKRDRIRFLEMKTKNNPAFRISAGQVENIALRSTGMSLAEIDSISELALRSAIRGGSTVVNDEIFDEAFETFNGGEVKKWDISQLEKVARHEAGHALICYLSGETPSYLTIVARGNHGGYMQHGEREDKAIYTKDELLAKIRTSLGGRAAEIVYYGEENGISTGAGADLGTATDLAQKIVCTFGMDDEFGLAVVPEAVMYNGNVSTDIRTAVNRILREQMDKAIKLISDNKKKLDSLVERLMDKNCLTGEEIAGALELENEASGISQTK